MREASTVKGNYMGFRPVNIVVLEGNELREAGRVCNLDKNIGAD